MEKYWKIKIRVGQKVSTNDGYNGTITSGERFALQGKGKIKITYHTPDGKRHFGWYEFNELTLNEKLDR